MIGYGPVWSPDGPADPMDRTIDHVVTDLRRSTLIAATARCRSMLASARNGPWDVDGDTSTTMVAGESVIMTTKRHGLVTISVETDMEPTRFSIDLNTGKSRAAAVDIVLRTLGALATAMDDPSVMSTEHALAPWYSALSQTTAPYGAAWIGMLPTPWSGFVLYDDLDSDIRDLMPPEEARLLDRALPVAVMARTVDEDGPHVALDPVIAHDVGASGRRDPMSTMRRLTILKDRIDAMNGRKDRTDDGRPEWKA
jgi:hypothetical protein